MYYVYVLTNGKETYVGYTTDLKQRLFSHQQGFKKMSFTARKGKDNLWRLAYYEAYQSKQDARGREAKLKHYGQSWKHLKNRIEESLVL